MDLLSTHSLELVHKLVLHDSRVSKVLAKLEDPQFIHAYIQQAAPDTSLSMRFELPRYNLGFELRQKQLVSLDYGGYSLSQRQQLVTGDVGLLYNSHCDSPPALYTLPNFKQYLLLQRLPSKDVVVGARRADTIALVPVGQVVLKTGSVHDADSSVTIAVDNSCSAHLQVRR